jgi:hypothetical protein
MGRNRVALLENIALHADSAREDVLVVKQLRLPQPVFILPVMTIERISQ